MEISPRGEEREKASSPRGRSKNAHIPSSPSSSAVIPRCDSTTFVQADTASFKHVVQMLTGSSDSPKPQDPHPHPSSSKTFPIPPIKKQGFKLYERRHSHSHSHTLNNSLIINTLLPNSSRNPESDVVSPSLLDFPSLSLSPVTPLNDVAHNSSSSPEPEQDKAFTTPRDSHPTLLPLFPLTSPTASDSPS